MKSSPGRQDRSSAKSKIKTTQSAAARAKATKKNANGNGLNYLVKMDNWLQARLKIIFVISMILTVFFGIMLFDVKISTGGDDSHYIEMANEFLNGKAFPSWHGPLYSVFLSIPILIFGVNIIWLKIISFIFIIAHLILVYYTFRFRVPATILALTLLILAVNSTILYFASQTYSEAMFMFLQSLIVFLFINIAVGSDVSSTPKKETLQWLILGFFVFLVSLTRNIGIVALLAMLLFLLIEKRFRGALMLVGSYLLFMIPFRIYKSLVWDEGFSKGTGQFSEILLKNPYNRALGSEDFAGMIDRFLFNLNSYLSKHFMIGIGLHDPSSTDKSVLVTVVIVILLIISAYLAFRRSKTMLFISIYLAGSLAATFIALQQSWDQMRMIVIFIPMLLLLLGWGLHQVSVRKKYTYTGIVLLILLVVIFVRSFDQAGDKLKVNRKILSRNIKGNLYYGFTPDWQNYLKMSEWVGQNIPTDKVVASRKPSMSYIYSKGRDFYGMYRVPTEPPEDFITELEKRTGDLLVFENKAVATNWPSELQWAIKRANVAYVAEGSEIYGLYNFKGQQGNEIVQSIYKQNIAPFSTDSLLSRLSNSKQNCFAVSPDSLINTLRKNNVEYIIVASLRANPNVNTGNIINNIQRYLYFVELKYPGILNLVHQIGENAEEPAWLYQVNYKLYGL